MWICVSAHRSVSFKNTSSAAGSSSSSTESLGKFGDRDFSVDPELQSSSSISLGNLGTEISVLIQSCSAGEGTVWSHRGCGKGH